MSTERPLSPEIGDASRTGMLQRSSQARRSGSITRLREESGWYSFPHVDLSSVWCWRSLREFCSVSRLAGAFAARNLATETRKVRRRAQRARWRGLCPDGLADRLYFFRRRLALRGPPRTDRAGNQRYRHRLSSHRYVACRCATGVASGLTATISTRGWSSMPSWA